MTIEELVIQKLRQLTPDQQQQVWEFVNALPNPHPSPEISPLGKKLRELRAQIVASGEPLLSREELDREITERRGGVTHWDE
jgi:gentisate 1,2-dioxygenase